MAYGYYTAVTIQSSQVLANHSNFPILIEGTFDGTGGEADLRTVANGGGVENTDGTGGASGSLTVPADFVVSSDLNGSSPYDFEFEKYDPATGEIIVWVKISTMDSASNQTIYMVYGDSGVTTSQENVSGVWSNNFEGVWHMGQGGNGVAYDSTANGNDLADNASASGTTGKIGDGQEFDGTDDYYLIDSAADVGLDPFAGAADATLMAWVYPQDGTNTQAIAGKINFNAGLAATQYGIFISASEIKFRIRDDSDNDTVLSAGAPTTGAYNMYTGVTRSGTTYFYENTTSKDYGTARDAATSAEDFILGARDRLDQDFFDGFLDEVRVSSAGRSENWITTTYNSFDVSTFLSFGSEVARANIQSVMLGANF